MPKAVVNGKRRVGARLKFPYPKVLARKIDEYFEQAEMPTLIDLALYLGMSRNILSNYQYREGYESIIKSAKDRCERYLVNAGLKGQNNPTMSIFILKNHYGYVDKQEIHQTNDIVVSINNLIDEDKTKKVIEIPKNDEM